MHLYLRIPLIPVLLIGGLIYRYWRVRKRRQERQTGQLGLLLSSLQDFVLGADRSTGHVAKIHHLLMARFAQEPQFEELMTATGSFIPGGKPPFLGEAALALKFSGFLAARYQIYLDPGQNAEGVWPPPPDRLGTKD